MRFYLFLITFGVGVRFVRTFWPPAYKVDLRDNKIFEIGSEETDSEEESEDEMIRAEDLAQFESLANDNEKFKPLHSHVERYNKRAAITATEFAEALPQMFEPSLEDIHNFVEEAKPFVVGFKHELDEFDFDDLEEKVFQAVRKRRNASETLGNSDATVLTSSDSSLNLNQTTEKEREKMIEVLVVTNSTELGESETSEGVTENAKITTEEFRNNTEPQNEGNVGETPEEEDYDYHKLKIEYYEEIDSIKMDNKTFNYTENGEPEETAEDAIKKIVDFKMPKNCTREEITQFGAKALECLAYDYKNAKSEKNVKKILSRTWIVLRIWVFVYLFIAIPCWCQKGWCCCCFTCTFCKPEDAIETAKKYYADNPPGILTEHKEGGKKETKTTEFEPTLFELEAFERFESAIRNL